MHMGNVDSNVQSTTSLQTNLLPRKSFLLPIPLISRDVLPFTILSNPTETKGHYRRDDPSFAVLLSFFLCIAALAWGLAYARGFLSILKLMIFMVGVDFALVGLLIATSAWVLAKKFLRGGRRTVGVSSDDISGVSGAEELEFGYCFDVHCNAFFPVFVWLYVVQYFVMPFLIKDLWYIF